MKESDAHPHIDAERADLFSTFDGGSTEIEYLDFLTALVRVEKPELILETGTFKGYGAVALLRGCNANGFGKIVTIDIDQTQHGKDISERVTYVEADSMEWIKRTDLRFDMAFYDSSLPIRLAEFRLSADRGVLKPGSLAIFHDTSKTRTLWLKNSRAIVQDPQTEVFWSNFNDLVETGYFRDGMIFPLSRGMTLARTK